MRRVSALAVAVAAAALLAADGSLRAVREGGTFKIAVFSYFNSPRVNRLLDEASRLTGAKRDEAYAKLDVEISRDAAPAIPYAFQNATTFVSKRTGCVVRNPLIDVTAACLK